MSNRFPVARNNEQIQVADTAVNFEATIGATPASIMLLPPGPEIIGRDGRSWLLKDPQTLVAAFNANRADLPIDIEHSTELKAMVGEPAPAVGWIKELRVDGGALMGDVEWNSEGAALVAGKNYRYISPVFVYNRITAEIVRLKSAALTNQPNLGLPALNRQQEETAMWKRLCAKLGLAETATEDEAMNAVGKLQTDLATATNRAAMPSLDKFVPRAEYDQAMARATNAEQQITNHQKEQTETAINTEIDAALKAGKITPASKDFYAASCRAEGGLDAFKKFIQGAPVVAKPSELDGKERQDGIALNADQQKIAEMFGNSVEDLKKYGQA